MTRPRKSDPERAMPGRSDGRGTMSGAAAPDDPATTERERAADLLVQLAGARVREAIDAEDARHDRMLEWMAAEARAALTPAERRELTHEGDALVARVRARCEKREPPG